MTSERYQKINSLVDALLDTPVDERATFLERACAGDAALRKAAEALVEAHESQDDFLQASALELIARDMAAEAAGNEFSGRVLGGYEIVSRLGAGGIGEVWLARDRALARQVALKLLSAKFVGDPYQVQRFKHEARAASQLNHPNIVTIHERSAKAKA
jgi:serine/threonine protein kinase